MRYTTRIVTALTKGIQDNQQKEILKLIFKVKNSRNICKIMNISCQELQYKVISIATKIQLMLIHSEEIFPKYEKLLKEHKVLQTEVRSLRRKYKVVKTRYERVKRGRNYSHNYSYSYKRLMKEENV